MATQKTIKEAEQEIVDDFSMFDSWDDKYEYIRTFPLATKLVVYAYYDQ